MSGVARFINKFNSTAESNDEKLKNNPYSDTYEQPQHEKTATDYARPPKGSKTEARGVRAGNYILNQVKYLCEIISKYGVGPDEHREIKFGYLFKLYEFIGDKVVGLLIRARKYGFLDFEGEMLYQRQDDNKPIVMLMTIQQIRDVEYSGDPVQCVKVGNEPNAPSTKGGNLSSPQPGAIVNKQGCRNFTKKQFGPQPGQTAPSFCVSYKKKE